MDTHKFSYKKLVITGAILILLYCGLQNLSSVIGFLQMIVGLLLPFIVGFFMAFVLNLPMSAIERLLGRNKSKVMGKLKRPISLILSLLFIITALAFVLYLVIPELGNTMVTLGNAIVAFADQAGKWINENQDLVPFLNEKLGSMDIDWAKIGSEAVNMLTAGTSGLFGSTIAIISTTSNLVFNFVVALVFAIYLLFGKETLQKQIRHIIGAYLPGKVQDRIYYIAGISNRICSNFIVGQCTEAVILGSLCALGMTILRLPYAAMVGALVGATALIPILGAFIGTFVGAFMILVVSPVKAVIFVVFLLILQQIEGNLIYPRVVGSSVGLPAMWVLAAVTIGGGLFGIPGMLVSVPIASILYTLFREDIRKRLKKKAGGVKEPESAK
jgi:predicted PurR-regulated permease PerM